jgi:RHS repeat-associated protein
MCGEEAMCSARSCFTGKERDAESGNDYFGARYYASSMGRWLSPDWSAKYEPVPYAKLDNPQTLNLYAYVLNNPLSKTDPDGHGDKDKDKKLPPPDAQHDHTITVRQVSGQGVNVAGHATVQIDGGKEVGYGPKQDMTTKQAVENTPVPGTVEPRAANAKTEDQVTIHVTGDQAKAAQATIDSTAKNPGNYVLHGSDSNNCANFAERVVNSAGGSAPHDTTPGQLVTDMRNQQYKDNSVQTH